MVTLDIKKRDSKQSLIAVRKDGFIPAVYYGPKEPTTSVMIEKKSFEKAWKLAGESTVITLKSEDGEHDAMIHDVDTDPISGEIRHADFYVVEKGKKIQVHVSVEFDGVAPAVKDFGGVLVKVMHEIEVEALPKDLPHAVHADVSTLVNFESHVVASEIKLPQGVTLVTDADEIIALVSAPKEEVEQAPVDISAIEVEKKGKEVKEGNEAEA